MHRGCVDGNRLLSWDVRSIFQVVVLSLYYISPHFPPHSLIQRNNPLTQRIDVDPERSVCEEKEEDAGKEVFVDIRKNISSQVELKF